MRDLHDIFTCTLFKWNNISETLLKQLRMLLQIGSSCLPLWVGRRGIAK